jgi:hypothetical protein
MFVRDFGAIARRRWILVLVGLLVSAGLAAGAWALARPTYQITAAVLLLPPASTVPEEGNPLLQLGGLDLTVDLLGRSLSDQAITKQIEDLSPDAEFEVGPDPSSSGPILRIQVRDKSEAMAAEIRDLLVGMAPEKLKDIQDGVGVTTKNRVTTSLLVADQVADPVGRDKLVAAVVAGAAGLVVWAVLIVLVDSALLRRAARRAALADLPADSTETPQPPAASGEPDALPGLDGAEVASAAAAAPTRQRERRRRSRHAAPASAGTDTPVLADPSPTGGEPAHAEAEA